MFEIPGQSLHPTQVHVEYYLFVEIQQMQESMELWKYSFSSCEPLLCNSDSNCEVRHEDELRHSPWPLHKKSNATIFISGTSAGHIASPVI